MRYVDEFRDSRAARALGERIRKAMPEQPLKLMEICGGHTLSVLKYGIRSFLPSHLHLVSGPGCPVCVSGQGYIDQALALSRLPQVTIATFGDMIRVPGSSSSLARERARGASIAICLSPLDALALAGERPEREIVFLAIGFETTAPGIAAAVQEAARLKLTNFSVLSALKTMPPAMEALLRDQAVDLQGFICPGHVSAITGTTIYQPVAERYHVPCVVSGFEPTDLLRAILALVQQAAAGEARVENMYRRSVRADGNPHARALVERVFEPCDAIWRGLGLIPGSGLCLRPDYRCFAAEERFALSVPEPVENPACLCGDIMRGVAQPEECRLFAGACTPEEPVGACMVSREGSCAIHYQYREREEAVRG